MPEDYRGHFVRLTDERIGHIGGHPEMWGILDRLPEVLRTPQLV